MSFWILLKGHADDLQSKNLFLGITDTEIVDKLKPETNNT